MENVSGWNHPLASRVLARQRCRSVLTLRRHVNRASKADAGWRQKLSDFNESEILMANQKTKKAPNRASKKGSSSPRESLIKSFWGVRYQVKDVSRSIDFYTTQLGFKLDHKHLPAFGQVSKGKLKLILSGPGASGSRALPDGQEQQPGGWNRVILEVENLPARIGMLRKLGLPLRNEMETGPGGKQIQLEDPDGNPIELFEPAE